MFQNTKFCKKCDSEKSIFDFAKDKSKKDGLKSYCKSCGVKNATDWIHNNREKYNARIRNDRAKNPEKYKQWTDNYKKSNPDHYKKIKQSWVKNNPEKRKATVQKYTVANKIALNEKVMRRNATKIKATPSWFNASIAQAIYSLAQNKSRDLGVEHQVDHIVPLNSKFVCGLHVQHNLQVVSATENKSKGNRWWPDMW